MKKTVLDRKLYAEGLRQLTVIGIVQAVLLFVIGVLPIPGITRFYSFVDMYEQEHVYEIGELWWCLYRR